MYISLYASTFNTKFNIQTQKGTWTTQIRTLLFRIFTECNILERHRLPERGFRFSTGFIYRVFSPVFFKICLFPFNFADFLLLRAGRESSHSCYEDLISRFLTWKHPAGRVLG